MALCNAISNFTNWLWGIPILILLVGGGIIIAFLVKGIQFRKFGFIWRNTMGGLFDKEEQAKKKALGVSPFQALTAALGATVGTGNIVGVGAAIAVGGPGALFWMWVCGFIAMGIKYAEVTLAVQYREKNTNGDFRGGPFMYIKNGLGWKPVAYIFGFLMIVCIAIICCVHGSSMATNFASIGVNKYITMICCVIFMAIIIFGGMKALVKLSDKLVPIMSCLYILAGTIVIIVNIGRLPSVVGLIIKGAFTGTAAVGGFTGAVFANALRNGLARGVFSNDAGLGLSATIQSQAVSINHPAEQGAWAVIETFIDTIVICTFTGLIILFTGVWQSGEGGATLAASGLASVFGQGGRIVCVIALVLFGLTSLITDLEGVKIQSDTMFNNFIVGYFGQALIVAAVILGTFIDISQAFMLADFTNGLILIINIVAIICLGKKLKETTVEWFDNPTEELKKFQKQKKAK